MDTGQEYALITRKIRDEAAILAAFADAPVAVFSQRAMLVNLMTHARMAYDLLTKLEEEDESGRSD